jgi:hypothetical protein
MNATAALTAVVTAVMKPLAARGGYRKERLIYRRRRGETLQVIGFPLSRGNVAGTARVYVDLAIAFDALYALEGRSPPAALREHEGHFRSRLEDLVSDAPPWWTLDVTTDPAALGAALGEALRRATDLLDAIDGPGALLRLAPLDRGTERYLRAQLHYVLGDFDAALADVHAGVDDLADRGATLEDELRALHLDGLVGRG